MRLSSSFPYGAYLVYSPRGRSDISKLSREICYGIKRGDPELIALVAGSLRVQINKNALSSFFPPNATLVPTPRSAPPPPRQRKALWPPLLICQALVRNGLARQTVPLLKRSYAIQKSALARSPKERPLAKTHFDSLLVERELEEVRSLILVDDVVTQGTTLLGSAQRLQAEYPQANIRTFALIRTMGFVDNVERVIDPVVGTIRLRYGRGHRQP